MDDAATAHPRALAPARETHDLHGEGIALHHVWEWGNRPADARQAHADAAAILEDREDWYRAGQTLQDLALAHRRALQWERARTAFVAAAEAFTRAMALKDAANCQSGADSLT
ncbi:hypothetical protein [Streptomyces sp. NPDC001135]